MIGFLEGKTIDIEGNRITLNVQGVGYEIQIPESAIPSVHIGTESHFFVRQIFREDGVTLCGFTSKEDRTMFDILIEAKGCGPKVALALIGQLGTETITRSVLAADIRTLSKATGVGQRLAERIVVEIRPKIEGKNWAGAAIPIATKPMGNSDLIEALLQLGYRRADAEKVAADVSKDLTIDAKIRLALQILRKS